MKPFILTTMWIVGLVLPVQAQLFTDAFTRTTLPPWTAQSGAWKVVDNALRGGTNAAGSYGFAFITNDFGNCSVEAQLRFSAGAYGGGLGGRFNHLTGSHYAAWVYPEGSGGGSCVIKLLRFDSYSSFSLLQQAALPAVGTNYHTTKLVFSGNNIDVAFDGNVVISVQDSAFARGGISVDMWTDATGFEMEVDNVAVRALPLAAADDYYTAISGTPLVIAGPGVLANDGGGAGRLVAALATGVEHGTLTLNTNGGFTYTPSESFTGTDSFTYWATDEQQSSALATVTVTVIPIFPLYSDTFNRAELTPWVAHSGNWGIVDGTLRGGTNSPQSYGTAYLPNWWANYAVQASIQLPAGAFGAGLDICLNPTTGARYAAWIYPEDSPGGGNTLKLVKFLSWTDWSPLQNANLSAVGTTAHTLKVAAAGNHIAVYFDQSQVISALDSDGQPYLGGGVGVDFWTAVAPYQMSVDELIVTPLVNDESYIAMQDETLTVAAPGVLANDTGVVNPALAATLVAGPTNGTLSLGSDGGFTYTPNSGYRGADGFTYRVNDGATEMGLARATVTVKADYRRTQVFFENFDGVTAPALPPGWTAEATGAQTEWVTRTAVGDTPPNSAHVPDPNKVGVSDLVSPPIVVPPGLAHLSFRSRYSLECDRVIQTNGFDGGVLEIKIGSAAFKDILAAGGSFLSRGYNRVIDSRYTNALAGRQAWSGTNGAFTETLVKLPDAAGGETIQLRWRCGTDSGGTSGAGWYIDTVSLTNSGPMLPVQMDRTIPELTTLNVVNTASRPDDSPGDLTYSLAAAPGNATISANGVITWTPDEAQGPGTFTFTTIVADNATPPATATNSFNVTVEEVNSGPVLTLPANQTVNEAVAWSANAIADDSDLPANKVVFELISGPDGLIVGPEGAFNWLPAEHQGPGTNTVVLRAYDNGVPSLSVTNSFVLTVREVNSMPLFVLPSDEVIDELVPWAGEALAVDTDWPPNKLTFQLVSGPAGLTVSPEGTISWLPTEAQGPSTNVVTVRVFDDGSPSLGRTNRFTLTVNEMNSPPALTLPGNQSIKELANWSANATATDADIPANTLTFDLVSGPAGFVMRADGMMTWTPSEAQGPSLSTVSIRVYDNAAPVAAVTNSFKITVEEANSAPLLALPSDQSINESEPWVAQASASDQDDPPNTTRVELVSGPGGLIVHPDGLISWTPAEFQGPSSNYVTLRALDNGSPASSTTNGFTVMVTEVNSSPVLNVPPDRTVSRLVLWSAYATATDPDVPANTLTFELVSGPDGLTVATDGLFNWTPSEDQALSRNLVTVRVFDDGVPQCSATNAFRLTVGQPNSPPSLTTPPNEIISELVPWSGYATATDTDLPPNSLIFELVSGPSGMLVDPGGLITWTPAESQGPAMHTVRVRVYDDGATVLSATNSFTLTVSEVNTAPTLVLPPDQTIPELVAWSAYAGATDSDAPANRLTFELVSGPPGLSVRTDGAIAWKPAEAQAPSTNLVTVRVVDSGSPVLSKTGSFTIVVTESNSPPVLAAQGDWTLAEQRTLTVTNTAADGDLPTQALTYSLLTAPSGARIATNGNITWTPTEADGPSTNTFVTRVVDDGVPPLSATNSFKVVVSESNSAPILQLLADVAVEELKTLIVTNTASDSDIPANSLSYALLEAPVTATIATNGLITWTPGEAEGPGSYTFTARVTDSGSPALSATNSFRVWVNEVNSAPVLAIKINQAIDELTTFTITNVAADLDMPAQTLIYSLLAAPTWATLSADGIISWTPTEAQGPGSYTFTTRVTDSGSPPLSATNSFTLVVNEVNSTPVLPAQSDRAIDEVSTLTVINTATDADLPAQLLTYSLLAAPPTAQVSAGGVITWTPAESEGPSTNTFITRVVDNGFPSLSATNSFTVVVSEGNSTPVLPFQEDRVVDELTTLTVTNTAADSDLPGNALIYALLAGPAGASISAEGVVIWTPGEAEGPGTYTITTRVTDTGSPPLSATNSFKVVVNEVNSPPSLMVQADRTIEEAKTLIVPNYATDADLPAQTMTYELLSAPATATISPIGVITWNPSETQGPGTYTITTRVTDNGSPPLSATNTFNVVVTEANSAPVLSIMADQAIDELSTMTITNMATDTDWPAQGLTYVLLTAPATATISGTGVVNWTPTEADGPSTNVFKIWVTDNGVPPLSATNVFSVVVRELNSAPVLPAQVDRKIVALSTLTVINTATDADLPTNSLAYALLQAPSNASINPNTGVITWTPTQAQIGSTNLLTTVVTDFNPWASNAQRLSSANSFTVVVLSGPMVALDSAVLTRESLLPPNNAFDPGETVTILVSLKNQGGVNTTDLTVTLLQTNGVLWPSSPQRYGILPAQGGPVAQPFTFTIVGTCGGTVTPTFQVQDGHGFYPAISRSFTLGSAYTLLSQSFDAITIPALPPDWTTSATGMQSPWITTNFLSHTTPNAVFSAEANKVGLNELVSPPLLLSEGPAQLTFRHRYDLEYEASRPTVGYDGGVLEVKIGTNEFRDILAAGGTFVSGGYNRVISGNYGSPLTNRQAWSGNSGAYVTTLVNLPVVPLGEPIQLRWLCATDNGGTSRTGWRLDTIALTGWACSSTNNSAPIIRSASVANGFVTVTWSAVEGRTYRLQSQNTVAGDNWIDCSTDVVATGPTAATTTAVGSATQQFYRVYLVP